jgi:hypothetical protein
LEGREVASDPEVKLDGTREAVEQDMQPTIKLTPTAIAAAVKLQPGTYSGHLCSDQITLLNGTQLQADRSEAIRGRTECKVHIAFNGTVTARFA